MSSYVKFLLKILGLYLCLLIITGTIGYLFQRMDLRSRVLQHNNPPTQVRNPYWCFDFMIGQTTVVGNVCRATERLCNESRNRSTQAGNRVISECRPR